MYCKLFETYVDDNHCDLCDKRTGYEYETWKYTCERVRQQHHPIMNEVRFWLRPSGLKFKLCLLVKCIANKFFDRNWTVWANREGWHVGKLSWKQFMIVDGEQR